MFMLKQLHCGDNLLLQLYLLTYFVMGLVRYVNKCELLNVRYKGILVCFGYRYQVNNAG